MELKFEQKETLKLFRTKPEVCRRHLTLLFPGKPKSTKYSILKSLVDKGLITIHNHATASYYTITKKGSGLLATLST
jgi:DNA-binding PadR family transcriptional regulator